MMMMMMMMMMEIMTLIAGAAWLGRQRSRDALAESGMQECRNAGMQDWMDGWMNARVVAPSLLSTRSSSTALTT